MKFEIDGTITAISSLNFSQSRVRKQRAIKAWSQDELPMSIRICYELSLATTRLEESFASYEYDCPYYVIHLTEERRITSHLSNKQIGGACMLVRFLP